MSRVWTPPNTDDLISRYRSGKSRKQLGREYGVTPKVIDRVLRVNGEPLRNDAVRCQLPTADVVAAYADGESEKAIADRYGVARNVVRRHLLSAGVAPRNQIDANRLMMSARTSEEHRRNSQAAHAAVLGTRQTIGHRCKVAAMKQITTPCVSPAEIVLRQLLSDRGLSTVPQEAIGPYNCDLGAYPVAVEVFCGGWHAYGSHAARARKRFDYLFDAGWNLLIVWVDNRHHPLCAPAADQVIAFVEKSRSDPSFRRQYRVIWSDGKAVRADCLNLDNLTLKPARGNAE